MTTTTEQMHADEFIGEVIGIGRLDSLHIDIYHREFTGDAEQNVLVSCKLRLPRKRETNLFDGAGKTMGLALRDMRERIRMEAGA